VRTRRTRRSAIMDRDMPPRSKERRRQASELYAGGLPPSNIAEKLGVTRRTLAAWRRLDEREGRLWDATRAVAASRRPDAVLKALHGQLADLVLAGPSTEEMSAEPGLYETRCRRLTACIRTFRDILGEPTADVMALERLVNWAVDHCTFDQVQQLRTTLQPYFEHLEARARG